jgi:pyruvate dehydrogenase (quinone)
MSNTTSDPLVRRLHEWGVRRVFGCPGDRISGLIGALQRASGAIAFVQARHEELAALEWWAGAAAH